MYLSTSPSSSEPNAIPDPLEKRQFGYGYGNRGNYSPWYSYGRWVLLGVIILVFIGLFLICSCITARKRRKRGAQPMYGTGWMAGNHGPVNYYGGQNTQNPPAQNYNHDQNYYSGYNSSYNNNNNDSAPAYNQYGGGNSGYYGNPGNYGGQQQGVELQQPPNAYARGGDNVYSPPSGPPPNKEIIR